MTKEQALTLLHEIKDMSLPWNDEHYQALDMAIEMLENLDDTDTIIYWIDQTQKWYERCLESDNELAKYDWHNWQEDEKPKEGSCCIVTVTEYNPYGGEYERTIPYFVWYGDDWHDCNGDSLPFEVSFWMYAPEYEKYSRIIV